MEYEKRQSYRVVGAPIIKKEHYRARRTGADGHRA